MAAMTRRGMETRKILIKDVGDNGTSENITHVMHSLKEQQNCFTELVKKNQQKEREKKG